MRKLKALIAGLTMLCMCTTCIPLPEAAMLSAYAADTSVQSSSTGNFVWGWDDWGFTNSSENFGKTYTLTDEHYQKLTSELSASEIAAINKAMNSSWGGSNYGLAVLSFLYQKGYVNPSEWQEGATCLHDLKADENIILLINYYHFLQFTDKISQVTQQFLSNDSEEEKLKYLLSCLESDSCAVVSYFGNFFGNSWGGHAVFAYGVEYGSYTYNNKTYDGKILVSDSNSTAFSDNDCLYFNTSDYSWTVPRYEITTENGAKLGLISSDAELLNANGYLEAPSPNKCGENLTWTLDSAGTLTISGTGKMTNWSSPNDVPWYSNRDNIKKVIIEDGVTNIGSSAFYFCKNMTSVTIPKSITNIENSAFYFCTSLTFVVISENVTSIGTYAFASCTNMTSVMIPNGVTNIGSHAFDNCDSLTAVAIPDSVTSIGSAAFTSCGSLTSVTIPENVISIGTHTFSGCTSLTAVRVLNPNCEIYDDPSTISDKYDDGNYPFSGTIYGYANSTAQAYAEKYNRNFVALDSEPETQPTTEPPTEETTEPATEPSREKKFVEGGDNWSFSNSRTNFGANYFLKDSDYKTLMNGLNNTEKEIIYDAVRNKTWDGSCYGMAVTSILASNGILKPENYENGANFIHDIPAPPSDAVKSLINYYFMLQQTDLISSLTKQAQYETEEEKLQKLVSCLEDESPTLLSFFGNFYGSKRNQGGHAVVAYGVDYGTYSYNGKAYNGKILIYDNIKVDYDASYCLYFNSHDWKWTIPYYQLDSETGAVLGMITDDISVLNYHGLLSGSTPANTGAFIAQLNSGTLNDNYALHKVSYASGKWMSSASSEDDIRPFSSLGEDSKNGDMLFALKDTKSGYMMQRTDKAGTMNLSMHYENTLMNLSASKGIEANFAPDGCIALDGENTDYELKIVLNEGELVTDWYSFSVNGGNTDAVALEKAKNGYILSSSDMKNIIAEAYNDEEDAFVNFSTDADSVFLYEIDKNTIGVKIDSNGDGTYDKLIAQTPESITGDANLDGTVDILDVITINKAVLGKETLTRHQNEFSDVNQNGVPDSSDALAVLKYIVGLTSSLK